MTVKLKGLFPPVKAPIHNMARACWQNNPTFSSYLVKHPALSLCSIDKYWDLCLSVFIRGLSVAYPWLICFFICGIKLNRRPVVSRAAVLWRSL